MTMMDARTFTFPCVGGRKFCSTTTVRSISPSHCFPHGVSATSTAKAQVQYEPILSFGTFFFDYDNDGWEDLVVFGYYFPNGVGDIAADYLGLPNQGAKPSSTTTTAMAHSQT